MACGWMLFTIGLPGSTFLLSIIKLGLLKRIWKISLIRGEYDGKWP